MLLTNKVKALMQLTNTKQIDIAKGMGVTQSYISFLLAKGSNMRIDELKQIVELSGGTVEISIILPDGTKL